MTDPCIHVRNSASRLVYIYGGIVSKPTFMSTPSVSGKTLSAADPGLEALTLREPRFPRVTHSGGPEAQLRQVREAAGRDLAPDRER